MKATAVSGATAATPVTVRGVRTLGRAALAAAAVSLSSSALAGSGAGAGALYAGRAPAACQRGQRT